jgi:hypothetical protein
VAEKQGKTEASRITTFLRMRGRMNKREGTEMINEKEE